MKSRIPTAVVLFAALAVLLAGSAQAASTTYTDPAGDSLDRRASMDIVAVRYDVRRVDKAGPRSLVVEVKLAAPPEAQIGDYEVRAQVKGCGFVSARYSPGTALHPAIDSRTAWFQMACGSRGNVYGSTYIARNAEFQIEGNTLRWSISLDELPEQLRHGSTFRELRAFAKIPEGVVGPAFPVDPWVMDQASTDRTWSY